MYEACDDLDDATAELQENRAKLEDMKHEVVKMRNGLQIAIRKWDRLVNTYSSSRMLNMRERNALQRDVDNVRRDIEEARSRIRDVENELHPSTTSEVRVDDYAPNSLKCPLLIFIGLFSNFVIPFRVGML